MRWIGWLLFLAASSVQANGFTLNDRCPPGFELVNEQRCELRSMYQLYDSLRGQGMGGTKTALPAYRDGFSPQQIDLGRFLFFDPILSGDGKQSCASCHDPDLGFSDGRARSVGHNGIELPRSAPSLWNVAFLTRFFWDGRAKTLEEQVLGPLYAEEEMANTPAKLLADLNSSAEYRRLFGAAFEAGSDITLQQIYTALVAFESSLISLNSPYDRYAHGDHSALSASELEGLNVFRSFVSRCVQCHTPPLFSNQQIAVIGSPEPAGQAFDVGAETTFDAPRLKGGFKIPSLRNIALSAPYMHSGRFKSLEDVVRFYNGGRGHAVSADLDLQLHWHITDPKLSDAEVTLLAQFLHTLTDETFKPARPKAVPSGLPMPRLIGEQDD